MLKFIRSGKDSNQSRVNLDKVEAYNPTKYAIF